MNILRKNNNILIVSIGVVIFLLFTIILAYVREEKTRYIICQDEIDNSNDIVITEKYNNSTGRFPDIIRTKDGKLIAAYYWNDVSTHAPYAREDSIGSIRISWSQDNGINWSESEAFIDEKYLANNNLGIWYCTDGYLFEYEEAKRKNASFCVDVRDPNFDILPDGTLIFTFFTRIPFDADENKYIKSDDNSLYTYGRTYIMLSRDNAKTWTKPAEIKCEYLNKGSAKGGNIGIYDDGNILISLYGYHNDNIFTTANVLAKIVGNDIYYIKEYCIHEFDGKKEGGGVCFRRY